MDQDLTPEQAQAELAAGRILLVDVREEAEWREAHIEGAVLAPLSAFDPESVMAQAEGRLVVFHCKAGPRAERVCQFFQQYSGLPSACMTGSIAAWKAAGLPVVAG
jgi:rhodanese-related sulfurtransferase